MNRKNQLSISEFSRLTGIRRENLRFYDRIGLLCPESRGENNYRYYSRHQLNAAYLISDLRGLGVGIEAIKRYAAERTPQKTLALFAEQDARIQAEIKQLREMRQIMHLHSDMVRQAIEHGENALFIQQKEREPIFLCPPVPPDMDNDEGGLFSYEYADAHGVNLGFPFGAMIAQSALEGRSATEDRYYFKMPSGGNAYKPAGLYAVAYGRCDPWRSEALYQRLLKFITEQNLSLQSDAYEEYPPDDLAAQQPCIRVEILVKAEN